MRKKIVIATVMLFCIVAGYFNGVDNGGVNLMSVGMASIYGAVIGGVTVFMEHWFCRGSWKWMLGIACLASCLAGTLLSTL